MATLFTQTESGFTAEQSAGAVLDYGLDWSDFLATCPGDQIVSSNWVPEDAAVTATNQAFAGSITTTWLQGGQPGQWYAIINEIETRDGRRDGRVCLLYVRTQSISAGSSLFKSRLVAIAKLRRDRLMMLSNSIMPDLQVSDDYLWEKLLAAEAHVAHALRVPLAPTRFFPRTPTPEQLAELPADTLWDVDPAYDYDPGNYTGDKWGMILARQKPIQSIISMKFVYPTPAQTITQVPLEWVRHDGRYGQVQIVPTGTAYQTLLGGMFLSQFSGGRQLPFTVELEYIAGLANAARDYPDLIDAVQKMAVVKIVEDAFMPQSGSISADGLSQSLSVDVSKYHEAVDTILNGAPGSNGGLMARIHGVRMVVI